MLGAVADMLSVADGAQDAITAALGAAADAVAVAGLDAAVAILRQLKDAGAGSTAMVIVAARTPRRRLRGGRTCSYPTWDPCPHWIW